MEIYYLEDHLSQAVNTNEICGVYWSARDMDPFFVGNHHFITFIFKSEEQARRVTFPWCIRYYEVENDMGLKICFATAGVVKNDSDDIIWDFTPSSDYESIYEIAKAEHTSALAPDKDFEGHRVPFKLSLSDFRSYEELMDKLLENIFLFNAHNYAGKTVKYALLDENCACMVNSIMKALGYSTQSREKLGEFFGVDWGEEDLIDEDYFNKETPGISLNRALLSLDIHDTEDKHRYAFAKELENNKWLKISLVSTLWFKLFFNFETNDELSLEIINELNGMKSISDVAKIDAVYQLGNCPVYVNVIR